MLSALPPLYTRWQYHIPFHTNTKTNISQLHNAHVAKNKQTNKQSKYIDHFTRCKQHWSRSTSCFSLTLQKSWDKIQPTEHLKLNKKVKQTSLRCILLHVK